MEQTRPNQKNILLDSLKIMILIIVLGKFFSIAASSFFEIDFQEYIPSLNPFANNFEKFNPMRLAYGERANKPDSNIILINLGEKNRKGIAGLLDKINSYQPKVVAIDAFFRRSKDAETDSILELSLSKIHNLVLAALVDHDINGKETFNTSLDRFTKHGESGYAQLLINTELNKVESFIPKININGNEINSFSAAVVRAYSQAEYEKLMKRNNESERINFIGNHESFCVVDIEDTTSLKHNIIKDKIVLVGFLDIGPFGEIYTNADVVSTPIGRNDAPDMFGLVAQANIISMILNENYINEPPEFMQLICILLILYLNIYLLSLLHTRLSKWYNALTIQYIVFVMLSYLFVTTILLTKIHYLYNPTYLIMMVTVAIPFVEVYYNIKDNVEMKIISARKKFILILKPKKRKQEAPPEDMIKEPDEVDNKD